MTQREKFAVKLLIAVWVVITAGIYAWARAAGQNQWSSLAWALLWPVVAWLVLFVLLIGGI